MNLVYINDSGDRESEDFSLIVTRYLSSNKDDSDLIIGIVTKLIEVLLLNGTLSAGELSVLLGHTILSVEYD